VSAATGEAHAVSVAAEAIRSRLGGRTPTVAVVLGSGLGFLADRLGEAVRIPYADIPGFPVPSVVGHAGELVCGTLDGKTVLAQSGRFHAYEGHEAAVTARAVRAFAELGIGTLLLTNAAGGIRRTFRPGTLMLISDHVNLTGRNPLTGQVLPGETRFPDMSDPYDRHLRALAHEVARQRGVHLEEGVYVGLLGPTYETPAEIRMLDRMGGDAVGMSTVLEVIAARARGMRCLGISTITNFASGLSAQTLDHGEVMDVANRVKDGLGSLVSGIIGALD
jgi:purine-nucleoside phosphorylase